MPTSLTSTYLIPAVLLNPVVILHGLNTFASHLMPSAIAVSTSRHQWLENLGPAAASGPYFDVHSNDQLCWGYTLIMVVLQVLVYGKVSNTRVRKKSARAAAKAERERKIALENERQPVEPCKVMKMNGSRLASNSVHDVSNHPVLKSVSNGRPASSNTLCSTPNLGLELLHIDDCSTETSSEEERIF